MPYISKSLVLRFLEFFITMFLFGKVFRWEDILLQSFQTSLVTMLIPPRLSILRSLCPPSSISLSSKRTCRRTVKTSRGSSRLATQLQPFGSMVNPSVAFLTTQKITPKQQGLILISQEFEHWILRWVSKLFLAKFGFLCKPETKKNKKPLAPSWGHDIGSHCTCTTPASCFFLGFDIGPVWRRKFHTKNPSLADLGVGPASRKQHSVKVLGHNDKHNIHPRSHLKIHLKWK